MYRNLPVLATVFFVYGTTSRTRQYPRFSLPALQGTPLPTRQGRRGLEVHAKARCCVEEHLLLLALFQCWFGRP